MRHALTVILVLHGASLTGFWVYNRFHVRGGMTNWERLTGAEYRGALCCYGEPVLGFVFLGKTLLNDMAIIGYADGIRLAGADTALGLWLCSHWCNSSASKA